MVVGPLEERVFGCLHIMFFLETVNPILSFSAVTKLQTGDQGQGFDS